MFNINGATKYKYIPNYHDMRGGTFEPIDIERMIMQVRYKQALTSVPACDGKMTDMEREQYQNRINELLGALETMLDANKRMGEKLNQANSQIEALQECVSTLRHEIDTLKGKNAAHNRNRFGNPSEKSSTRKAGRDKGKTKEQEENDFIENEGKTEESLEFKLQPATLR